VPVAVGAAVAQLHPFQDPRLFAQARTLAYWDENRRRFVVEPGKILVTVGGSSADIRLQQTIEVFE
jgi:hypothetical protein